MNEIISIAGEIKEINTLNVDSLHRTIVRKCAVTYESSDMVDASYPLAGLPYHMGICNASNNTCHWFSVFVTW